MKKRIMVSFVAAILLGIPMAAQTATAAKNPDNVNVVNTPSVVVQNDSSKPIPVQDVGTKQTPFQVNQNFGPSPFLNDTSISFPVTVPAGKRLVIEHVSARATLSFQAQTPFVTFAISTTVAG